MLPVLLYHFERSERGLLVLIAFLVSCALLMAMSWIVAFDPRLALKPGAGLGVPVKNYIDQSQEFTLVCRGAGLSDRHAVRAQKFVLAACWLRFP
jgi:O-antigen ligase